MRVRNDFWRAAREVYYTGTEGGGHHTSPMRQQGRVSTLAGASGWCRTLEQPVGVVVVDLTQHVLGQIQATQQRRGRPTVRRRVIGIGDGTGPFPVALPEGALAPVAARIM